MCCLREKSEDYQVNRLHLLGTKSGSIFKCNIGNGILVRQSSAKTLQPDLAHQHALGSPGPKQ